MTIQCEILHHYYHLYLDPFFKYKFGYILTCRLHSPAAWKALNNLHVHGPFNQFAPSNIRVNWCRCHLGNDGVHVYCGNKSMMLTLIMFHGFIARSWLCSASIFTAASVARLTWKDYGGKGTRKIGGKSCY